MWIKMCIFAVIIILCVIMQHNVTYAKRILFIANMPSYSHQISYRGLSLELHKRGYEIVSVTTDPIKNTSLTNYTEIDLNYFYHAGNMPDFDNFSYKSVTQAHLKLTFLQVQQWMWDVMHIFNRLVFEDPEMKKLYAPDSNEHFDAVIVEQGPTISLNALAYRFNAPLIGISSLDVYNHMRYILGSLILPSHISNWEVNTPTEENMSFWQRLVNFYEVWMQMYTWMSKNSDMEDKLAKKYLGSDLPHINDITRNMSIYLINRHLAFSYGRPEHLNVIFYHGFHIAKTPDPLPKNIKQFLDDVKDGFIYISLGSNVKWEDLPNNVLESFIEAFSKSSYKILWKINPTLLHRKFPNILALNWLPQQSILAHPKIKLFIYQGGLQSTEEAINYEVPLLGFPIIWDQKYQVQNIVRLGIGISLYLDNITTQNIENSMQEILNNKRYKDKISQLSKLSKDVPYDSLENAIKWIEYVIRQNGTTFLRSNLCYIPWYQRFDWDIIGFLVILLFIVFLTSIWILYQIFRFHLRILSNTLVTNNVIFKKIH